MSNRAIFEGLIFDENDNPVTATWVGQDLYYVVDDAGFLRHIPSKDVDRQIWDKLTALIEGNEGMISEQAAKMLGQEDLFTVAMIQSQLKNTEKQFKMLVQNGIPDDSKAYMGMMGFRVTINIHGDVLDVKQPGIELRDED